MLLVVLLVLVLVVAQNRGVSLQCVDGATQLAFDTMRAAASSDFEFSIRQAFLAAQTGCKMETVEPHIFKHKAVFVWVRRDPLLLGRDEFTLVVEKLQAPHGSAQLAMEPWPLVRRFIQGVSPTVARHACCTVQMK